MKKIIINADDFGLSEAVTLGIISGHVEGIISSTSLMVNMGYAKEACKLAENHSELGLGVHLNVTLGKPISNISRIPSLVNEKENFYSGKDYSLGLISPNEEELLIEFDAQIQKFIELTGKKPDHINYHHKYDFFGLYPKITDYLIEKYNVPLRLEQEHTGYPFPFANKMEIMMKEELNEESFYQYIENNVKDDLVELPNHAGFVDYELIKMSSLSTGRTKDLYLLKNTKIKELLIAKGYEIVNWSKVEPKERRPNAI